MGVRSAGRTLVRVAAILLLGLMATFVAAGQANADDGDLVKVFVVADPGSNGQVPTLSTIANSTLGDSGRAGEIFTLNKGLRQPDGGTLTGPDDQLHAGWILRLPPDASGPEVRVARDTGQQNVMNPAQGSVTPSGDVVTVPLAVVLAVIAAILVALITAAIVGRRVVGRWLAALRRAVKALGDPARRRRLLSERQSLGRRFAADGETARRAYDTVGEVAIATPDDEGPVYAVRIDQAGAEVWIYASETLAAPWEHIDGTRWRRPPVATGWADRDHIAKVRAEQETSCLVRVGTETDGVPVFVDLSRLDGVLSVTGNQEVARDVVQSILTEIARIRPNLPVVMLRTAESGPPLTVPSGLALARDVPVPAPAGDPDARGPVRSSATRRPVRGVVVATGRPNEQETAELMQLCGPGGGWTGLVVGEVRDGAHWRWHATADGTVDIPLLGIDLKVPAGVA